MIIKDGTSYTRVRFMPSENQMKGGLPADLANVVTAMPVVNAIPAVCAARVGIQTYADLPLIKPYTHQAFMRRSPEFAGFA